MAFGLRAGCCLAGLELGPGRSGGLPREHHAMDWTV
jgi:hypothetical protein